MNSHEDKIVYIEELEKKRDEIKKRLLTSPT